jgi:hypothetical protein
MSEDALRRRFDQAQSQAPQQGVGLRQTTPRVNIEETLVDQLREHQRRLTDYVKSYVAFSELASMSGSARDYFEVVARRQEGLPYLQQLRTNFEEITRKFFVRASVQEDLPEVVGAFEAALDGATGAVQDAIDSPQSDAVAAAVRALTPLIRKMIDTSMEIERHCHEKSDEELASLESVVDQILSKKKKPAPTREEAPAEKPGLRMLRAEPEGERDQSGPIQIVPVSPGTDTNAGAPQERSER